MKVELEKTFPMPTTAAAAWAFLQDIEGVAGCMPGAKITERVDVTHYKGTISVRVGPASMAFKGELEVLELNESQRTLHLVGKGSDTTGSSGASMDLLARIEPGRPMGQPGVTEDACSLVGRSEVIMSGKAAAFGGRMMGSVADQILKQFASNFATQARDAAAVAQPDGASTAVARADELTEAAHGASGPSASTELAAGAPGSASEPDTDAPALSHTADAVHSATGVGAGAARANSAPANELNALALFWAIVRDWFRGLFRRKPA